MQAKRRLDDTMFSSASPYKFARCATRFAVLAISGGATKYSAVVMLVPKIEHGMMSLICSSRWETKRVCTSVVCLQQKLEIEIEQKRETISLYE